MKVRGILIGVAVALTLAAPANAATRHQRRPVPAPVEVITIANDAHVPTKMLTRIERAVVIQSRQVRRWWHTPVIRFGAHGWLLSIAPPQTLVETTGGTVDQGWHSAAYAMVEYNGSADALSITMSHELIETLVNPTDEVTLGGWLREACDPVSYDSYQVGSVIVSDFVTPAWFTKDSRGPWDQIDTTTRAGDLSSGYGYQVGQNGVLAYVGGASPVS
jgi:hypothetical protein